jgi:hypothetical protein
MRQQKTQNPEVGVEPPQSTAFLICEHHKADLEFA